MSSTATTSATATTTATATTSTPATTTATAPASAVNTAPKLAVANVAASVVSAGASKAAAVSVAEMVKRTYKQIPADKCTAAGGKHINLVMDPTVGYCLCPEGQGIADAGNPKCAPIDAKTTYDPFASGFYREGTQCKTEEGLVTQKHPWHQNFGEAACIASPAVCLPGFEKQQLKYGGEILDYCVRKDAKGNFLSSYYPTTFLIRPPEVNVAPKVAPPKEEKGIPKWAWYVLGSVVGALLIGIFIYVGYKLLTRPSDSAAAARGDSGMVAPAAPTNTTSFSVAEPAAPKVGGRGRAAGKAKPKAVGKTKTSGRGASGRGKK